MTDRQTNVGAGVAQRLCNGLPLDGPGLISGGYGIITEIYVYVLRKGQ